MTDGILECLNDTFSVLSLGLETTLRGIPGLLHRAVMA